MGNPSVRFDARKFGWLGSVTPRNNSIMVAMKSTGVHSVEDAQRKELVAGASAKGSHQYTVAAILNEFLGTKIKIVTGYPSIASIYLAMESGELQATGTSWEEFQIQKPDFVQDQKVNVLIQNGPKAATLPNVPTFQELLKTDDDREIVELLLSGQVLGRPFATTPGVPEERLAVLRTAFEKTLRDEAFLKEAHGLKIEVEPITREEIQTVVNHVLDTPGRLIPRARSIIE
jgi:tripartite-type tricarboxylate transporter receptor subunit TctC